MRYAFLAVIALLVACPMPSAPVAAGRLCDHGRDEDAREAYPLAVDEHLRNGDLSLAGRAAHDLGRMTDHGSASSTKELHESQAWYLRSAEYYERAEDLRGAHRALNDEGHVLLRLGLYYHALSSWSEALAHAEALEDAEAERQASANLALGWLVVAEGGIGHGPDVPVEEAAEVLAQVHYLAAIEAAERAGRSPSSVCEEWGGWAGRCDRIQSGAEGFGREVYEGMKAFERQDRLFETWAAEVE